MIASTEPVIIMTRKELDDLVEKVAKRTAEETARRIPSNRPPHVNQTQAAEMLRVSRSTISNMLKFGTLSLNECGMIPIDQIDSAASGKETW